MVNAIHPKSKRLHSKMLQPYAPFDILFVLQINENGFGSFRYSAENKPNGKSIAIQSEYIEMIDER